jgi:hypothetical protein
MPRPTGVLGEPYKQLQIESQADLKSERTSEQTLTLALIALKFLNDECRCVVLVSSVKDKQYWAYHKKDTPDKLSRPFAAQYYGK